MMQLNFCQDLESPKPAQHSLFYEYLCYMLLFGLGSAVNTAEEEEHGPNKSISNNCSQSGDPTSGMYLWPVKIVKGNESHGR